MKIKQSPVSIVPTGSPSINNQASSGVINHALEPQSILSDRFLRKREVMHLTGLSSSAIYSLMSRNLFPQKITLAGGKAVAWLESSVMKWKADCLANQQAIASK